MSKNQKSGLKNYTLQGNIRCFQRLDVHHIGSLTEKRREMAPILGNTEIFSKLHTDVRDDEFTNYFTTVNT